MPRPVCVENRTFSYSGILTPLDTCRDTGGIVRLPHKQKLKTFATKNRCPIDNKTRCYDKTKCAKCQIAIEAGQQMLSKPKPKVIKVIKRKGFTTVYHKVEKKEVK